MEAFHHGTVSSYAHAISMGFIKADDGRSLFFSREDWLSPNEPRPGDQVFFNVDGKDARAIKLAVMH
jgi:hypothetical protein